MKKRIRLAGSLITLCLTCSLVVQGCATSGTAKVAADRYEQPSPIVLSALAKLGHVEGGRTVNTFFIPKKPSQAGGASYVIYWKEKNVLFYFPAEVTPEVADNPFLVRRHEYKVEESTFRREGDPDYATSTHLMNYGWALQRLIDAVVDGRKYELKYEPPARPGTRKYFFLMFLSPFSCLSRRP